jgi:transposase
MHLWVLSQDGEIVLHRKMKAAPEPFLQAIAPSREGLVVCVEGLFTWSWLADLWAQEGIPCVLGPARSMKAIHGGTAKHDQIDAHKLAVLRRGGMLPQASVYPAAVRAPRDLLRRRLHWMRQRAELLAHVQHTTAQDNLPEIGKKIADKAHRTGIAERFSAPAVQKSIAVDLGLSAYSDRLLTALELDLVQTAKAHEAHTFYRRRSIPGVGKILALVLLDELHDMQRFPRVQAFGSSCRLVKCAKASAGTRDGTSGKKIGHASRKWAFSAAAVLFLRNNPAGQQSLARVVKKHGKGKALTGLAHQVARAVYDMGQRDTAFALDTFLHD